MLKINNDQLKQFYEKCQKDKLIGVDTEFYRVDTYYPELCLIQLSNNQQSIILDPKEASFNLDLIKKLLFNTRIKKIFYAARQDVEIFYHIFNKIPCPIIDIQICLLALDYSNSTSYAKACNSILNVKIDKQNQFIDWRKRPLSKNQKTYAINDVKYLIPLFKKIEKKLSTKKLLLFKKYYSRITDYKIYSERAERAWKKIRFKPNNNQELKNLKKYSEIREIVAMEKNIPVKRVITDSELKAFCRDSVNEKLKAKILNKLSLKSKKLLTK